MVQTPESLYINFTKFVTELGVQADTGEAAGDVYNSARDERL
jgi:hypothetical protein